MPGNSRCLTNADRPEYIPHEEYMHDRLFTNLFGQASYSFDYTSCFISVCLSEVVKWIVGWFKYPCIKVDDLINVKLPFSY